MNEEFEEIRNVLFDLRNALLSESESEWEKTINSSVSDRQNNDEVSESIWVKICGDIILSQNSSHSEAIRYLVATYDNDNIRIILDNSPNHGRAHIHIGIRKDKYHSVSIALDNGEILNNSGNIADWKIKKIADWVVNNRIVLEKMWRCINNWGDSKSADKRKGRLSEM